MLRMSAIYGSPRRGGNSSRLLSSAVEGARTAGAQVEEIVLRDLEIAPCLEIYGCKTSGRCVIRDDFQNVLDRVLDSRGLMVASPIFFYGVSAHTKAFIDRCQSLWVKKYWVDGIEPGTRPFERQGLFISVGATHGKRLFEGALLTIRYWFDVLDMQLWKSLLYRGLDFEGDVLKHPDYLQEARQAGEALARRLGA